MQYWNPKGCRKEDEKGTARAALCSISGVPESVCVCLQHSIRSNPTPKQSTGGEWLPSPTHKNHTKTIGGSPLRPHWKHNTSMMKEHPNPVHVQSPLSSCSGAKSASMSRSCWNAPSTSWEADPIDKRSHKIRCFKGGPNGGETENNSWTNDFLSFPHLGASWTISKLKASNTSVGGFNPSKNKNCQWESIDFQASKLNTIEPNQSTIFVDSHSLFF